MSASAAAPLAEREAAAASNPKMSSVSLEIYPELNGGSDDDTLRAVNEFVAGNPAFISVTCTKQDHEATLRLSVKVKELGQVAALHLLGGDKTEEEARECIDGTVAAGVDRVVALRGDRIAKDKQTCDTVKLVELLQATGKMAEISVAGYPDVHPKAASETADLEHLQRKIDAGAQRVISQFSFNADSICRFRDAIAAQRPEASFSAGLLPVRDYAKTIKFANKCETKVDESLRNKFESVSREAHDGLARSVLKDLTVRLVAEGIDIHYYTLNKVDHITEAWLAATLSSNGA
ncbi:MAG: methylenetetrahydrofolate reductase [Betaproteobacteria bacterium AqS2]|uniref:Methylenetetrahydrofolate reductase n=1 Tax=Candidatus Amphirhobacter heronislandensis TaxID=1732024 RepID=A0A930XW20_9GAMM|nr:methylenetetrahydrofolate reductase [Betaproteobacteria bacterium AqS2]